MSDELNNIQSQALDGMNKAINHLETELVKVRAGKSTLMMTVFGSPQAKQG